MQVCFWDHNFSNLPWEKASSLHCIGRVSQWKTWAWVEIHEHHYLPLNNPILQPEMKEYSHDIHNTCSTCTTQHFNKTPYLELVFRQESDRKARQKTSAIPPPFTPEAAQIAVPRPDSLYHQLRKPSNKEEKKRHALLLVQTNQILSYSFCNCTSYLSFKDLWKHYLVISSKTP